MIRVDASTAYEELCLSGLRAAGFRITMPRIQVIRALADAPGALSAYAIHEKILGSGGRIDVVSVYRILSTLQQVGLIHHIGIADGYFPCRLSDCGGKRTMVLVDADDRRVFELPLGEKLIADIQSIASEAGHDVADVKIELTGSARASGR